VNDRPPGRTLSDEERAAVAAAAGDEPVIDHVVGLGASLIVTSTRAIVARQGAHFRPRSGIRSWPLASLREVHLVSPRRGNGRVVIRTGPYPWQAVSLFVAAQDWPDAERVVGQIRHRAARARRPTAPPGGDDGGLASDPFGDD
jgi:hypothetical protein